MPAPHRHFDDSSGFPSLVEEVATRMVQAPTVLDAIAVGLTFDGRVPLHIGRRSLDIEQESLYRTLLEAGMDTEATDGLPGVLGIRPDGRLTLASGNGGTSGDVARSLRRFTFTEQQELLRRRHLAELHGQAADDVAEARGYLSSLRPNELHDILANLQYLTAHGAPLNFYVDDAVFSSFRFVNNLAGKVLLPTAEWETYRRLSETTLDGWTDQETIFVYCAHLLSSLGGQFAFEEFNGNQLSPRAIRDHFADLRRWHAELGVLTDTELGENNLFAEARSLSTARTRLREQHQPYRKVFGVVLNKQESYLSRELIAKAETDILRELGIAESSSEFGAYLERWLPGVVTDPAPRDPARNGPVEALLCRLVSAVALLSGADMAMSRGTRSMFQLATNVEAEAWKQIIDWDPTMFYCCVMPGDGLPARYAAEPQTLVDSMWAIAARMEYNSWHNLPDNVPDGDERHTRDYVYAQRMPDVAEWSDQHHRGHVTSGVRHTVRAPGAVHVAGRRFAALVDIRILRQQGDPFADEDVAVALAGSSLAAMIVEKLAAAVRAAGVDHRIEAFGPAWYRQRLVDWREESAKQPPPTVDGVRAAVRATAAYTPPLPDDDRLRLHLNENHYGPAPACAEALTDITKAPLSFYGVGAHAIEECIAAACGLDATSVFVNHGESAVLRQVFQAAVEPGDVVLLPRLAWAYYGTLASLAGATTACFPVLAGQTEFRYDVEALLGWRGRRPALVVINSPHMPTGQSLPSSDVARIAGAFPDSLILLDEAYAGFDNPGLEDLAAALERHPNLVIARSFSKLYGLADLRIGYGLANPGTTAAIRTAGPLFGLGRPARAAAAAALASSDYYADLSRRVVQSRERLSRALAGTGVLKPYRSHANFLIVHTGHIRPQWLTAELAARGFHVRDCGSYGLDRHLRLSIATEEQTELLGDELTALVEKAGDPPVMPSWL